MEEGARTHKKTCAFSIPLHNKCERNTVFSCTIATVPNKCSENMHTPSTLVPIFFVQSHTLCPSSCVFMLCVRRATTRSSFHSPRWMCACVCVWQRERERETWTAPYALVLSGCLSNRDLAVVVSIWLCSISVYCTRKSLTSHQIFNRHSSCRAHFVIRLFLTLFFFVRFNWTTHKVEHVFFFVVPPWAIGLNRYHYVFFWYFFVFVCIHYIEHIFEC